jgi:hyperosmotically inducible periplasmic protein
MKNYRHAITLAAAVATALSLTACGQRSSNDASRSTDSTVAATPAPDTSQKMAAASNQVATAVDDSALTAKVKAALIAEPGLKSLDISVDTKNAAVTLSGSVDSVASRDRAKEVASGVSGVATVVDQMTIKTQG